MVKHDRHIHGELQLFTCNITFWQEIPKFHLLALWMSNREALKVQTSALFTFWKREAATPGGERKKMFHSSFFTNYRSNIKEILIFLSIQVLSRLFRNPLLSPSLSLLHGHFSVSRSPLSEHKPPLCSCYQLIRPHEICASQSKDSMAHSTWSW